MERKIHWITGCHDEIELVYERAEQDENIGKLLAELEEMALSEAEKSCGLLLKDGKPVTKEMVLNMSEQGKEIIMYHLSGIGLLAFNSPMTEPKITVKFSPHIRNVLGCTLFSVMNRLEKLDGAYNVLFPNATLVFELPLGARKGMFKWEMLIMRLYPWLSIREESYNAVADELVENISGQTGSGQTGSGQTSNKAKKPRTQHSDQSQKTPYAGDAHKPNQSVKQKTSKSQGEKEPFFRKVTILQLRLMIFISVIIAIYLPRTPQLIALIFIGLLILWALIIRLKTAARIRQEEQEKQKKAEALRRRSSSGRDQRNTRR